MPHPDDLIASLNDRIRELEHLALRIKVTSRQNQIDASALVERAAAAQAEVFRHQRGYEGRVER